MAKPISEQEIDALAVYNEAPFVITVRCRNVWRINAALVVLQCAIFVARLLGVGVHVGRSGGTRRGHAAAAR